MIACAFSGQIVRDAEAKTSKNRKPYTRFSVRLGNGEAAEFVSVMSFDASVDPANITRWSTSRAPFGSIVGPLQTASKNRGCRHGELCARRRDRPQPTETRERRRCSGASVAIR